MQALKCRRLYSAAGRGVRHDRPGTVVWGRAGRVLGVWLVLLGLVGCGLPGGGKQQPDWTGLAERLITEAGTDQIVGVSVDVSGQLDLTFRVAGGYTSWSYTGKSEPRQYNESADRARGTVTLADIDFAALTAAIPPDCMFGSAEIIWLPFGHTYQYSYCDPAKPAVSVLLDGKEIPFAQETINEQAIQSAIDVMTQPLPGGEALEFWISLHKSNIGYTMTSPEVTLPDGATGYLEVYYSPASDGRHPLTMNIIADPPFVVTETPPPVAFRPADIPGSVYLQTLNNGLPRAPFPPEAADGIGFSPLSDTELGYSLYSVGYRTELKETIPR